MSHKARLKGFKMKKLALLATVALIGTASADVPACATAANSFYAGVSLGLANTNVKYNMRNVNVGAAVIGQNYGIDAGKAGLQYGVLGGYNMGLGNGVVVGVELFAGGDSSKVKNMNDNSGINYNVGKESVKRTMYYGLAPRIGYMITPNVLAYVRLGVEAGKWKAQFTPDAAAIDGISSTVVGKNSDEQKATAKKVKTASKNRINFAPGVGMDVLVSKNIFVRAQYHYVFGPKMTINWNEVDGITSNLFNGSNQIRTYKVSQHVVSLAVGYKF